MKVIYWLLGILIFLLVVLVFFSKDTLKSDPVVQDVMKYQFTKYPEGSVKIKEVIDGDTIELETGEKVRYIGMNTPETVDPRRGVQCYGKEASRRNKELVENVPIYLEKDVSEKDKYGRLLRYVYLDDPKATTSARMVNAILVAEGYANVSTYPPDVKYKDLFLKLQKKAFEDKLGLWRECKVKAK